MTRTMTLKRKKNETISICIDFSVYYTGTLTKLNGTPEKHIYSFGNGLQVNSVEARNISICYNEDFFNRIEITVSEDNSNKDTVIIEDSDVDFLENTDNTIIEDSDVDCLESTDNSTIIEDSDVDLIIVEDSEVDSMIIESSDKGVINIKIPSSRNSFNINSNVGDTNE